MSRLFYHVMQDNTGNLLFDVSGTMRLAGTGTAATIYGDEALTIPIANPMTNHPSFGSFKCFLGAGDYDFYMAKSGYTFETLTGVQGHGTMAQQDANAVAITGGSATGLTGFSVASGGALINGPVGLNGAGNPAYGTVLNGPSIVTGQLDCQSDLQVTTRIAIGGSPHPSYRLRLFYLHSSEQCIGIQPSDNDTGGSSALLFANVAGSVVGNISCTASATAYNTASDVRLKHAITPLTGALDVVRALRPVSFLWKADGTPGRGFLAHEVADVVDGVITGEVDAVDAEGQIAPQMIDYSTLVPWLVSAVKELTQQVEMLQAQLAEAGA